MKIIFSGRPFLRQFHNNSNQAPKNGWPLKMIFMWETILVSSLYIAEMKSIFQSFLPVAFFIGLVCNVFTFLGERFWASLLWASWPVNSPKNAVNWPNVGQLAQSNLAQSKLAQENIFFFGRVGLGEMTGNHNDLSCFTFQMKQNASIAYSRWAAVTIQKRLLHQTVVIMVTKLWRATHKNPVVNLQHWQLIRKTHIRRIHILIERIN